MKELFRGSILLLCVAAAACSTSKTYTVATYNVGVFHKHYENSVPEVAAMLHEAGVDIVGLNELDSMCHRTQFRDELKEFAGQMGDWEYNYTPAFDYQEGKYGIGLCADPKLGVLGKYDVALGQHDGAEERMMSVMELNDFVYATLHIDHVSANARAAQSKIAEDWLIEHFGQSGKPVLLCGDFNATPDSDVIAGMAENWTLLTDTELSYPSDAPETCIDYIFQLKNGAELKVKKTYTLTSSKVGDPALTSDHLAKIVTIKLK